MTFCLWDKSFLFCIIFKYSKQFFVFYPGKLHYKMNYYTFTRVRFLCLEGYQIFSRVSRNLISRCCWKCIQEYNIQSFFLGICQKSAGLGRDFEILINSTLSNWLIWWMFHYQILHGADAHKNSSWRRSWKKL